MDLKKRLLLLGLAMVAIVGFCLLNGCKPREIITSDRQVKDSVTTKQWVEYRDTVIIVEADSAAIMAMVPGCPDMPEQVSQNGRVRVSARVKDGMLSVDCKCKELEKRLQLEIRNRVYSRVLDSRRHDTRVIWQKFIPWPVKALAWTGGVFLVGALAWIIIKLVKLYIKVKPF